jgi:hypothetical protein
VAEDTRCEPHGRVDVFPRTDSRYARPRETTRRHRQA